MIGNSKDREAIAALQDTVRNLSSQVARASSDVTALAERYAVLMERGIAVDAMLETLSAKTEALALSIASNAEYIEVQNATISASALVDERRAEQIMQCRGMIARLERQVKIDLDELRETNHALASRILRPAGQPRPSAAEAAADGEGRLR